MKRIILIIPLLLIMFGASAQQQTITGKVLDRAIGGPFVGTSIVNQETGKGTMFRLQKERLRQIYIKNELKTN